FLQPPEPESDMHVRLLGFAQERRQRASRTDEQGAHPKGNTRVKSGKPIISCRHVKPESTPFKTGRNRESGIILAAIGLFLRIGQTDLARQVQVEATGKMIIRIELKGSRQPHLVITVTISRSGSKKCGIPIKKSFEAIDLHSLELVEVEFFGAFYRQFIAAASLLIALIFYGTDVQQGNAKPELVFIKIPALPAVLKLVLLVIRPVFIYKADITSKAGAPERSKLVGVHDVDVYAAESQLQAAGGLLKVGVVGDGILVQRGIQPVDVHVAVGDACQVFQGKTAFYKMGALLVQHLCIA